MGTPISSHQTAAARDRKPLPASVMLSPADHAELDHLAAAITCNPSTDPAGFCLQARACSESVPATLLKALRRFARLGSESGIFVVQNLPVGDVPTTPPDNTAHVGESLKPARVQAILNHTIGFMIGYEAEGEGRLFQDMVPKKAAAATQTSLSSKVELELHTEQAFSDLKPDWISLACAREQIGAKTYVLPVGVILEVLTAAEIDLLKQPLWITGVDESFRVGGHDFVKGDVRGPMPILQGDDGDLEIVLDQDLMRGTTDEATTLMEKLYEIYRTHRLEHTLKRGELLLVDNRRAVHGRSPFKPRFDGTDRFVIRSFVVKNLQPSSVARARHALTVIARFS